MSQDFWRVASAARTLLFVPGDRPERFEKAAAAGADLVVLDLEDAVAGEHKGTARDVVVPAMGRGLVHGVRINAVGTPWHEADLHALAGVRCVVMLPKAQDPVEVAGVAGRLASGSALIALVETALGILAAPAVAAVEGVARLAFGSFDLAAELGVSPDDRHAMAAARGALVIASAAARIAAPVDGVTGAVNDAEALASDVAYARRLGFTGKLCIHPRQVQGAADGFAPSIEEIRWATTVLAALQAADGGAVLVEGQMVDKPVVDRAARILAAAPEGRP